MDPTEAFRRAKVREINSEVQTNNQNTERKRLEAKHGQVWNTDELTNDFDVSGFMAPFVVVTRKSDGVKGGLMFQHMPRFYFNFQTM